jgi:hypothetical protein
MEDTKSGRLFTSGLKSFRIKMEQNNNEDIYILKGYRFICQHPFKIDDVLNPNVKKKVSKLVDEETKDE